MSVKESETATVIASAVLLQSSFAFRNAFESQKSIVTETCGALWEGHKSETVLWVRVGGRLEAEYDQWEMDSLGPH